MPGTSPPPPGPRGWEPRNEIFFSMSCDSTCSWLDTCASKSLILLVTFFRSCASPPLPATRNLTEPTSAPSASPPLPSSDSTRDSSFLNFSLTSAVVSSVLFLRLACSSLDSAATTSDAYFFTSVRTCDRSAVEASRRVVNMESVSLRTFLSCSHSAPTSAIFSFAQALDSNASTDSVWRWPACMVSMSKFWFANIFGSEVPGVEVQSGVVGV
mmetsp:Transcript_10608/g.30030  ORF Transcript_10608/g.30030 Transcript_10608/m.30030 type:complete len:213 (+) Transcript_10608:269-907(+)